ncbi:MAG: SDR family oxidoreductase [Coriobacteriia bacterium]|nr:SDR family oxidoreductase [Coriobacteriia bacterium]
MAAFEDKVAFVTGAGSGIGREVAVRLAQGGAKIAVSDIDATAGAETVSLIEAAGGAALFVRTDVSKAADVEAAIAAAVDAFGGVHIVVNNAGIGGEAAPTGEYSLDGWHKVININLNGVFYGMRYGIPAILASGGGSIVNVSSVLGLVGWATAPAYVTAKHGVAGLTKTAAIEYAQQGIRVNSVHPGFIATPLLTNAGITEGSDAYAFIAGKHAMNRLGTAEEVTNLIVWLASDEASFVTGSNMTVDGGFTCQ